MLNKVHFSSLKKFSCLISVSELSLLSPWKRDTLYSHCKTSVEYLGLKHQNAKARHRPFANRVFFKIMPLITQSNAAIAPVRWTIFSGEKSHLSVLS